MKALTKYAALALVAGLWSCTSTKLAQQSQGEYDDLYFTSKDREQALTASASSSSLQYDQMDQADDASAPQNANPDYVATDNRRQNDRNGDTYNNAGETYYDDSYADRRRFGSIRPSVASGVYSSPAYYDPFFSPYGYDSFHARNAYSSFYYDPFFSYRPYWGFRPGVSISISYNTWGRPWGWNSWGYDPWGYNAWNSWGYDPFWGGGYGYGPVVYNNFYGGGWGGGWNRPWYGGGNTYIINNGRDNTATRNYGPRGSRSSDRVNDRLDNSPRDRNNGGRLSQEGDDTQVTRPTRARSPRGVEGDPYGTTPGTPREGYRSGRTDVNTNPDVITTRPTAPSDNNTGRSRDVYSSPRPARPQGSDYSNGGSQRSSDYYNSNRSSGATSQPSQPTYSAPRSSGYEYSRPSRSNSDGGYNSGSSGSYNSGRSSGGYSGGSAPASSPSSGGSSSGGSRARGRN